MHNFNMQDSVRRCCVYPYTETLVYFHVVTGLLQHHSLDNIWTESGVATASSAVWETASAAGILGFPYAISGTRLRVSKAMLVSGVDRTVYFAILGRLLVLATDFAEKPLGVIDLLCGCHLIDSSPSPSPLLPSPPKAKPLILEKINLGWTNSSLQ